MLEKSASSDELDQDYSNSLAALRQSADEVRWTVLQAQGIAGGERRHWSSVLLIKISLIAQSILHLSPDRNNPGSAPYWDFSSIASLARNLFEAIAFFNYISEPVAPEVFAFRVLLMGINDHANRLRIFEQLGLQEQVDLGLQQFPIFREEMSSNSVFQSLSRSTQNKVLAGNSATLSTLREMAGKGGVSGEMWGLYDYLSTHAHTLPVSFFRVDTHGRNGRENESEKTLLTALIPTLTSLLDQAVASYRTDHQGLVVFSHWLNRNDNLAL